MTLRQLMQAPFIFYSYFRASHPINCVEFYRHLKNGARIFIEAEVKVEVEVEAEVKVEVEVEVEVEVKVKVKVVHSYR